jgi:hypothetical protein
MNAARHGLECKKRGLVISRHNEIRDELGDLASRAFTLSAVRDGPRIRFSRPAEKKTDNSQIPLLPATFTRIEAKTVETY